MGWKKSAKRTIYGERHYIEDGQGGQLANDEDGKDPIWFRPRKWSIAAQDAIGEEAYKLRNELGPEVIGLVKTREDLMRRVDEATKKRREESGDDTLALSNQEVLELMSPDEIAALMHGIAPSRRFALVRAELYYGIGDHNFKDDNDKLVDDTEGLVDQIMDLPDILAQMIGPIEELNRPLLQRLVGDSGMPHSTSTIKSSSQRSPATTPTDKTPESSSESGDPGSSNAST